MNLVLLEPAEAASGFLPAGDPRATHLLKTLRLGIGGTFDCGVVDGPRGKATVTGLSREGLSLEVSWAAPSPAARAVRLIVGLPRPQTARDILRDATTLGATRIDFVATERSDPSYAASTLWSSGEWRRHCLAGASQAFDTRLPAVTWTGTLPQVLETAVPSGTTRIALDNYEATRPLSSLTLAGRLPLALALGPERGWGPADRAHLRAAGWTLAHLGTRVLRLETAATVALGLALCAPTEPTTG